MCYIFKWELTNFPNMEHLYIYIYMCMYKYIHNYIHIHIYINICIYIYSYTCIFSYTYIFLYIYIYILQSYCVLGVGRFVVYKCWYMSVFLHVHWQFIRVALCVSNWKQGFDTPLPPPPSPQSPVLVLMSHLWPCSQATTDQGHICTKE